MSLASGHHQRQWSTPSISPHVELRAEAPAAPPESLVCLSAFGTSGVLVSTDHRAIHKVHRPIYASVTVCELLQRSQDTLPDAGVLPAVEAAGDRMPRTILFGQVPPGCAGGQDPKDAIEDVPVRVRWTPDTRLLRR
jgi:hypothetical protein